MNTDKTPPANATRRIKWQFDERGKPVFVSTKSPVCFGPSARVVLPPHDVIPIVFVPGIAGTNLKTGDEETWTVPNKEDLGVIVQTIRRSQDERQTLFDPLTAEVNWNGQCVVEDSLYCLTSEEAKRRGWGALHAGSYHGFMQRLEMVLNTLTTHFGEADQSKNRLLPEIGLLQHLGSPPPAIPVGPPAARPTARRQTETPEEHDRRNAREAEAAWGKTSRPLSEAEIRKLGSYYYPVWAYGYNWLQSNEISAEGLLKYIDEKVLACYEGGQYFQCAGKVIVVTHSMGGLVARRAAQMLAEQGKENKILGILHGAQPVMGAPALYRRLRAGQEAAPATFDIFNVPFIEAAVTAAFMGWSERSMTVQLARAPGALELAPTCHYPPDWLRVTCREGRTIFSLPKEDPYKEIYSKTTDDCWWGMVNPAYVDPAGTIRKNGRPPTEEYMDAVGKAKAFHDKLGLYAHPETYGFYGIDDEKYRSFGHVKWYIKEVDSPRYVQNVQAVKDAKAVKYASGEVSIPLQYEEDSLQVRHGNGRKTPLVTNFKAILESARNQRGDGTVPEDSSKVLEKLAPIPKEVFAFPGFDHQGAFKDEHAILASFYFIGRIVQKAPPPTERKGAPPC
jgi:hypothetical protein